MALHLELLKHYLNLKNRPDRLLGTYSKLVVETEKSIEGF